VPLEVVEDCPTREVLDRVGDKWSVLVIVLLGQRTHRFNELHRAIEGISQPPGVTAVHPGRDRAAPQADSRTCLIPADPSSTVW
jgi:hypothetical protein